MPAGRREEARLPLTIDQALIDYSQGGIELTIPSGNDISVDYEGGAIIITPQSRSRNRKTVVRLRPELVS